MWSPGPSGNVLSPAGIPAAMSRAGIGLTVLGLAVALAGLALALLLEDRFLGLALLLVGGFLMVLPLTRPSLDE